MIGRNLENELAETIEYKRSLFLKKILIYDDLPEIALPWFNLYDIFKEEE